MKILIIKSLFIPHESYISENIRTIDIFSNYLLKLNYNYTITLKIIGWINQKIKSNLITDFHKYLKKLKIDINKSKSSISVEHEIWGENKGKSYLLREFKFICPSFNKYNYIIYADHDVSPIDDLLNSRIIIGSLVGPKNKRVALVSFDQVPDNRHNPRIYKNELNIMDITFYYPVSNSDIATGCFITTPKYFALFGELKSVNIYGDEDILISDILDKNNLTSIVSEHKIDHQFDLNADYAIWKKNIAFNIIMNNKYTDNNFWKD
jgi:hypothetical protein